MIRIFKTKKCTQCNTNFTPNSSRHRFCKKECSIKYKLSHQDYKICPICNSKFKHLKRETCSEKCYFKLSSSRGHKTKLEKNSYKKCGARRKGKSMEEQYGLEKSNKIKIKQSVSAKRGFEIGTRKINSGNFKKGIIPHNKGIFGKYHSGMKDKTFDNFFGEEKSKVIRDKISTTVTSLYLDGTYDGKKKFKYKNTSFRSSWEAKVAKYLDKNNIRWEYETTNCRHKLNNGRTYIVDFFLPDLKKWIEVKGYWDKHSISKCDDFLFSKGENKLIIIDYNNIEDITLNTMWNEKSKKYYIHQECTLDALSDWKCGAI